MFGINMHPHVSRMVADTRVCTNDTSYFDINHNANPRRFGMHRMHVPRLAAGARGRECACINRTTRLTTGEKGVAYYTVCTNPTQMQPKTCVANADSRRVNERILRNLWHASAIYSVKLLCWVREYAPQSRRRNKQNIFDTHRRQSVVCRVIGGA